MVRIAALAAFAAEASLRDFCRPFNGKDCEIIWRASTNGLPATVKIQKVVPTTFSPTTVSNLLQLAGLSQTNRIQPPADSFFSDQESLLFNNQKESSGLIIVPAMGFVALSREGVIEQGKSPAAVPSGDQALKLTLALLPVFGVKESELVTEKGGLKYAESGRVMLNKATGKVVTGVLGRSISLTRQIDHIPVWRPAEAAGEAAGIRAEFGNQGQLASLDVVWRAVRADKDCPIPTVSEFISRIKSGQVLIRARQTNVTFKKLTVEKVQLYYWEAGGTDRQTKIRPFAVLETKTDQPGDNANIELFVPLEEVDEK